MSDEQHRRILRLFGPPGTGKTTDLAERVKAAVRLRGPDSVVVASFTTTAAHEIGSRGLGLPRGHVGTLHSHAYRIIGNPPVATDAKVISDWNEQTPRWEITGTSRGQALSSSDNATPGSRATTPEQAETGDELLSALDLLRARGVPSAQWPPNVRAFAARWTAWKREVEAVDFTDMTMEAYKRARDGEGLPGNVVDVVVDEAQDCTPLELALAMQWGRLLPEHGRLVFGFDDDQAIAQWRGGDPAPLLDLPEHEADTVVLEQSYRVPPAVHAVAQAWIGPTTKRYAKDYHPRAASPERGDADAADAYGYAYRVSYELNSDALADAIEADLDAGEEPMVLASCGYMLNPLIKRLRQRGLPFHNPYRPADGQWNPLGSSTGMSTAERVARYLVADPRMGDRARLWTGEDISAWSELISLTKAGMIHGAARYIENLPRGEVPWELVAGLWKPGPPSGEVDEAGRAVPSPSDDLMRAVAPDLEWFAERVLGSKAKVAAFPLQVARTRGPMALTTGTRAVVGTIHSTKGATCWGKLYLAPDLSAAGARQWSSGDPNQSDQMRRLFYVGVTRAYRELVVLAPGSHTCVNPAELLPPQLEVRRPGSRTPARPQGSGAVANRLRRHREESSNADHPEGSIR